MAARHGESPAFLGPAPCSLWLGQGAGIRPLGQQQLRADHSHPRTVQDAPHLPPGNTEDPGPCLTTMSPACSSTALAQRGSPTHSRPSTALLSSVMWTLGRGVEADYCAAHRSNLKLTPAHALRPREGPLGSRGLREAIRHGLTCLSHRAAWPPSTSPCPTSPGKGAKQPHSFYRCLPNPSFCSAESNFFFWSTHSFRALYNRYEARQQRFPPHPTGEEEGKGPARTTEPPVQALPPPSSSFQAPPCPSAQ